MIEENAPEKINLDRLHAGDLHDVFHDAVIEIVNKANAAIEDAETQVNDYREKLEESKSACEGLDEENKNLAAEISQLKERAGAKIDFEAIEQLINFAPGDPGKLYPLHERAAAVIKRANQDRDKLAAELADLKTAIIPELERLEGHEKRLQVIVNEFAGKVKGERLSALLREAKAAFSQA